MSLRPGPLRPGPLRPGPEHFGPILAQYGLECLDLTPVNSVYRSRAAFRVGTSLGPRLLKEFRHSGDSLVFSYRATEHLIGNGLKRLPRFHLTARGLPYTQHQGKLFVVADWVEGRNCDFTAPEEAREAARALAEIHLGSIGFTCKEHIPGKERWGVWPERYRNQIKALQTWAPRAASGKKAFDRKFSANLGYFLRRGKQALDLLEDGVYDRLVEKERGLRSFCHKDYTPSNVIRDPGGGIWAVDFDSCCHDLRAYDLAQLITNSSGWEIDRAVPVLEAYDRVSPISLEELRLATALLGLPREFFWAGHLYYQRPHGDQSARVADEILDRVLVEREKRETFLKDLTRIASGSWDVA